ncbi:MAG: polyketide synthase dehydratase domain-containing protein, partial [Mycobacterium sp.]
GWDGAAHSPQVDPILDELVEALAGLEPRAPDVPYYSATLWNPRERPSFDADYWAENLRYTVRFAAAVQAALKDGFRVFGELSPQPLLTDAVQQNAAGLDMPVAALAARDRATGLGLREFVAALHSAGAAVDFSVVYPTGRLVDAPLATWTHRELLLSREAGDQPHGASVLAVHPLLGAHVRLREEPVRHVWQGDVGTGAQPWLGDHLIHDVAALPAAAYCEMALAAARATIGEVSEVCDVRFEQALLLATDTQVLCTATVSGSGVLDFIVDSDEEDELVRRASAVLRAPEEPGRPPAYNIAALIAAHPCRVDGAEARKAFDAAGIHYGPAFSGLTATLVAHGVLTTVLAEIAVPGVIRSELSSYVTHPALLDACFQSVITHPEAHPEVQQAGAVGLLVPVGVRRLRTHQATRDAHYCLTRITSSRPGFCEADIEVLDATGGVLLTVEGLLMASWSSEEEQAQRLFNERLFTIEWEPRELPEARLDQPGSWLLLAASGQPADPLIFGLDAALNDADASRCATATFPAGPLDPDDSDDLARLRSLLSGAGLAGVVVVTQARPDGPEGSAAWRRGRDHVARLSAVARELAELDGEPPRLFVVTRNAASVVSGDLANLELAGLRGLMRVIDAEHPHLGATQVDVDAATDAGRIALQLRSGSDEDETAWRDGQWYTARLRPGVLRPADRRTTVAGHAGDGMRLQIRAPGDLESLEFVAVDRVPPGPGEIEVAVAASTVNVADVLVAFGRYPPFEDYPQTLGGDFAGMVSAVGPGVTGHKVGDRVGGLSPHGCWGTFVIADARLAITLPPQLPLADAAAVPTAAATAWYGLHDLARITPADRVLVHSATGGVGQAAIAIARLMGCEIFATAGSPQRRQLLRDMGIGHIYDSRSTDFADEIRRDT